MQDSWIGLDLTYQTYSKSDEQNFVPKTLNPELKRSVPQGLI